MKILLVHKFNFIEGGAGRYFLALAEALQAQGHEVAKFCMAHPDNLADRNEKYFISQVDYRSHNPLMKLKSALRMLWSFEAARRFERLISDFKPDVIHLHNIYHQISPSILPVAKKHGLPVVMHLHDYKLVCPDYNMYSRDGICEKCKGGRYYQCALNRCVKNSFAKSALATLEMYLHHRWLKVYEQNIDLYVAPSEFMRRKVIEWGVPEAKVVTLPYFVASQDFTPDFATGDYLVFFGRLEKEKGIYTLLNAISKLDEIKLKIVGRGSESENLRLEIKRLGLDARVELVGVKQGQELHRLVKNALAAVVPSEWYEVTGLVNLEAGLLGKPVVAARIGGIPEAVQDGKTGLLFEPGSAEDLAAKIKQLINDKTSAEKLGRAGREWVVENFDSPDHIKSIETIYKSLIIYEYDHNKESIYKLRAEKN